MTPSALRQNRRLTVTPVSVTQDVTHKRPGVGGEAVGNDRGRRVVSFLSSRGCGGYAGASEIDMTAAVHDAPT